MHPVIKDADARMRKGIESFKTEIGKLRTGRATPGILDHVRIDYYGTEMPINQVASINVSDAHLDRSPWEKRWCKQSRKAILNAGLGFEILSPQVR